MSCVKGLSSPDFRPPQGHVPISFKVFIKKTVTTFGISWKSFKSTWLLSLESSWMEEVAWASDERTDDSLGEAPVGSSTDAQQKQFVKRPVATSRALQKCSRNPRYVQNPHTVLSFTNPLHSIHSFIHLLKYYLSVN